MTGWNVDTLARPAGAGAITVVEGSAFCVSGQSGDIEPDLPHGVFFRDTRLVSRWTLLVNGARVEPLSAMTPQPYRAVFVGRAGHVPGRADTTLIVERDRRVGVGLREDVTLRSFSPEPTRWRVEVLLEADFADIFEVKEGRIGAAADPMMRQSEGRLVLETVKNGDLQGLLVSAPNAVVARNLLAFDVLLPPRGTWAQSLSLAPTVNGEEIFVGEPSEHPVGESEPERRFLEWHSRIPSTSLEDDAVERVILQSQRDLGSLRIFDPDSPQRAVVAAGAPWFMALFGRDSLLTSYMTMLLDPTLALGTLQTLAELQGKDVDPVTEEEPGRILHEVRLGATTNLALGGGSVYYGTADATPLFVVVLGELARWGVPVDELSLLLPSADRALDWIRSFGDRDDDGFIEYQRLNEHGLINQGWKDSWDGINFADGRLAEAPIALCEVQGYAYAAFLARAELAALLGDTDTAARWSSSASELKQRFNERFWLPDRGYFAVALDRDKQPVDACASNMGHCLWTGIVDDDKAPQVAERLLSEQMFSGWGIRTLGSDMGAFNPASYHNGSVWPHDNAIIVAGLMRCGFVEHAQRVAFSLLEAAEFFGDRLPELFCGFDRRQYPEPVPYPASCSPQAWAAAAPLQLLRSLLRFDPALPEGEVWLAPALPDGFGYLHVVNVPLATSRVSLEVSGDEAVVTGLPDAVRLRQGPRLLDRGHGRRLEETDRP